MSTSSNKENLKSINIPKQRGRSQQVSALPKKCYLGKIPIAKSKYADLTKVFIKMVLILIFINCIQK